MNAFWPMWLIAAKPSNTWLSKTVDASPDLIKNEPVIHWAPKIPEPKAEPSQRGKVWTASLPFFVLESVDKLIVVCSDRTPFLSLAVINLIGGISLNTI